MSYFEFEREPEEPDVRFEEWYCTELARHIQTVPIINAVLGKSGINAWIDAKEVVQHRLLEAAQLPGQEPLPWVAYQARCIDPQDDNRHYIANDKALAMFVEAGIKEFWWYGPWQSNWSELDRMTAEEIEKHSPIYSHAVWDYNWAYKKFDVEAVRQLAAQARQYNINLVIWATQTMSQCSPFVKAHPEWALRRPDGTLFNYVYRDLVGMSHASGYSDFFVSRMTDRMREVPFDTLWLDSFFFSGDLIDWMNPHLTPNLDAALGTVRKLFAAGVRRVYCEHHGPFILSSATGYLSPKEIAAGKNLFLLYNTAIVDHMGNNTLDYAPEIYFKLLAFKCCPQPYLRHYFNYPEFRAKASYVNKAYARALPLMEKCVVLPGEVGTLYFNNSRDRAILFTFVDGTISVGATIATAWEVLSKTACPVTADQVTVEAYQVYQLQLRSQH